MMSMMDLNIFCVYVSRWNFDGSYEMTCRYNLVDYLKPCFNLHAEAAIRLDLKNTDNKVCLKNSPI